MIKAFARPFFCAANKCFCHLFENVSTLFEHPELNQDEKVLWLRLATESTKNVSRACTYSYEQLSLVMDLSCKQVHRALFRLVLTGFLRASLPIWYGEPTSEMCREVRLLRPIAPSQDFLAKLKALKENENGDTIHLSNLSTKRLITINLLKKGNK